MPGRPITMMRRIDHLRLHAGELVYFIGQIMPDNYKRKPSPRDRVATAWNKALNAAAASSAALQELAEAVSERTGVPVREITELAGDEEELPV
jgi:hypothetical protein